MSDCGDAVTPGDASGERPFETVPRCGGRAEAAATLIAMLGTLAILLVTMRAGWIRHDEGQFAHGAERVLNGELPHRDFDEMYSGLITYWHAAWFSLFGPSLLAMRWALLTVSVMHAGLLYWLGRQFCGRSAAIGLPLAIAACTLMVIPEPIANWYLSFSASCVLWALLRWQETGRYRWLSVAAAGGAAGLAIKVTGLYAVAASLVALSLPVSGGTPSGPHADGEAAEMPRLRREYVVWCILVAVCGVLAPLALIARDPSVNAVAWFVIPPAAASLSVAAVSRQVFLPDGWPRRLSTAYAVYLKTLVVALAILALPWMLTNSLDDLFQGLFVLPQLRLTEARLAPPEVAGAVLSLPLVLLCVLPERFLIPAVRWGCLLAVTLLVFRGVESEAGDLNQLMSLFHVWAWWLPLAGVAMLIGLARERQAVSPKEGADRGDFQKLVVLLVASFLWLNQYPYPHLAYLLYGSPVVFLCIAAFAADRPPVVKRSVAAVLALLAGACVIRLTPHGMFGEFFTAPPTAATLAMPRGGLIVDRAWQQQYAAVIEQVQGVTQAGDAILAGPDAPEVYFLTDRENPTRWMYDFFRPESSAEERLIALIDEQQIEAVVVNRRPAFSRPWSDEMLTALRERFQQEMELSDLIVFSERTQSQPGRRTGE